MPILTKFQEEIIIQMSQTPLKENFFLTGGTALSHFYLEHRFSEDLDFFTEIPGAVPTVLPALESIQKKLSLSMEVRRTFNTFVEIILKRGKEMLLLHFAQDTPYRLKPTVYHKTYGIYVDNFEDIACNKFSALFDRHDMKDFVDIYFIDREKMKFEEVYALAKTKHLGLDDYWLSQALQCINDLTLLPRMIKSVTIEDLRYFFNEKIKYLMRAL